MIGGISSKGFICMVVDKYRPFATNIFCFIIFCFIFFPIAIYFGTSTLSLFYYFFYVILFNVVPGTLLYCCLRKEWNLIDGLPLIGWTIGLSLEVSLYNIVDQLGLIQYFNLYPIISILICGIIILRRNFQLISSSKIKHLFFPPFVIATALSLIFIALQDFSSNIIDLHFASQASHANRILIGWPYQYIEGIPLFYNYLIHTHIASASQFTGIGTLELATRSVPFLLSILCLSVIYYFSINNYKNKWIGILVIAQIFGVIGYQFIQRNFFGSAIPSAAVRLISTLVAFPIFFVLVSETFREGTASHAKTNDFDYGRLVIVLLLLWSASGIRSPALIAYGAGLAPFVIWNYYRYKVISWNIIIFLISSVVIFGLSLIRFYGVLSPFSATAFLEFVPGPAVSFDRLNFQSFRILQKIGLPFYISGVLAFLLMMSGKVTFLTGGIFWLLIKKQIFRHRLDIFWFGTFLCGCFFWYFTFAGGGSQGTFLHYAHFCLAFVGARGLYKYISRPKLSCAGLAVIVITILMSLLHFGETGYTLANKAKSLQYQQYKPSLLGGEDYRLLIDYFQSHNKSKCSYLVVGDMEPTISEALPAEIVRLRQFGSFRSLQTMINRHANPELVNRLGFLNASSKKTQKDLLDSKDFLRSKNEFTIPQCITIIIAEGKGLENKIFSGNGWMHKSGRFAVLQL